MYWMINKLTVYMEDTSKDRTKEFRYGDELAHQNIYLKTFGYDPSEGSFNFGLLDDIGRMNNMNLYFRIVKRYYSLYTTLLSVSQSLSSPLAQLLKNTKFAGHFNPNLFCRYTFKRFIHEDFLI